MSNLHRKKILIIGATGYIGSFLIKSLNTSFSVAGLARSLPENNQTPSFQIDLFNLPDLILFFEKNYFDVIVYCAGNPSLDWAESEPEASKKINVDAFENMIHALSSKALTKTKIILVSTCYVFGEKTQKEAFTESYPPNPINIYGKHKYLAETALTARTENYLIVRLPLVIGNPLHQNDAINVALTSLKNKKKLFLDNKEKRYPTDLKNISRSIAHLINANSTGIFHLSSQEPWTRYQIALHTLKLINPLCVDYLSSEGIYPDPSLWKKVAARPSELCISSSDQYIQSMMDTEKIQSTLESTYSILRDVK